MIVIQLLHKNAENKSDFVLIKFNKPFKTWFQAYNSEDQGFWGGSTTPLYLEQDSFVTPNFSIQTSTDFNLANAKNSDLPPTRVVRDSTLGFY